MINKLYLELIYFLKLHILKYLFKNVKYFLLLIKLINLKNHKKSLRVITNKKTRKILLKYFDFLNKIFIFIIINILIFKE